jgi:mycofactocin precursor
VTAVTDHISGGPVDTVTMNSSTAVVEDVETAVPTEVVVEEELLVEDVSIDGMCGVY